MANWFLDNSPYAKGDAPPPGLLGLMAPGVREQFNRVQDRQWTLADSTREAQRQREVAAAKVAADAEAARVQHERSIELEELKKTANIKEYEYHARQNNVNLEDPQQRAVYDDWYFTSGPGAKPAGTSVSVQTQTQTHEDKAKIDRYYKQLDALQTKIDKIDNQALNAGRLADRISDVGGWARDLPAGVRGIAGLVAKYIPGDTAEAIASAKDLEDAIGSNYQDYRVPGTGDMSNTEIKLVLSGWAGLDDTDEHISALVADREIRSAWLRGWKDKLSQAGWQVNENDLLKQYQQEFKDAYGFSITTDSNDKANYDKYVAWMRKRAKEVAVSHFGVDAKEEKPKTPKADDETPDDEPATGTMAERNQLAGAKKGWRFNPGEYDVVTTMQVRNLVAQGYDEWTALNQVQNAETSGWQTPSDIVGRIPALPR